MPAARSVRAAARPSARARGGAHLGRRPRGRAGDAAHRPALLVGHDDQRRAQAGRAANRLQAAHRRQHLPRRPDVAREEDDARRLAARDPPAQPGRRTQAVVGEDHVLADGLAQRQRRRLRGARTQDAGGGRAPGGKRDRGEDCAEHAPHVVHDLIRARVALLLLVLLPPAPATALAARRPRCTVGPGVRCLTLTVPVDRAGLVPGTIRLLAARIPSRRPTRPPLVALTGGPGQAGVVFARSFDAILPNAHRDLVVLDQRGTGSSGLLRCRGFERRAGATLDAPAGACGRGLGPRRSFYTSADSADDLEALRVRLGVAQIALYAVSYGTRVALEYARRYPRHVERMILDSTVTLDHPDAFARETLASVRRVVHAACRRGCRGAGAHPIADLSRLRRRLRRAPLRARVRGAAVRVDADDLLAMLVSGDLEPPLMRRVPAAVRAGLHGDGGELARLKLRALAVESGHEPVSEFSPALFAATTCEEAPVPWDRTADDPATRRRQALAALRATPAAALAPFDRAAALHEGVFMLCGDWPAPVRAVAPPPPLPAGVPALILSGELDLRTPLQNAQRLARALGDARLLVERGVGHDVLGARPGGCVDRTVAAFLARRPAPTCR
jgi:pimeloyl-ACP methyl ester carboxylesterase